MNILVTGSNGFIAKNLCANLKYKKDINILSYNRNSGIKKLEEYCAKADFVYHLAGVNRPDDIAEYFKGNCCFTITLLTLLKKQKNSCPILYSSSTQAELNNPYGCSKKQTEDLLLEYSHETGAKVYLYRLPNIFGKWARPNYNSAVATFCYQISHDLPVHIENMKTELKLVYIDDLVHHFLKFLGIQPDIIQGIHSLEPVYCKTLEEIYHALISFKSYRENLHLPDLSDEFTKKLYSTYLSYADEKNMVYGLKMNSDQRGSFTEFIRTGEHGQFSVNVSTPGMIKGNHWHNTKNEKFLVVSGEGTIRLRNIYLNVVHEIFVDSKKLKVVEIPPGFTHHIENTGNKDLVTLIWTNECYDPDRPDTFSLGVWENEKIQSL